MSDAELHSLLKSLAGPDSRAREEARQALEPLMEVLGTLGRLPEPVEFPGAQGLIERFGSLKRAFAAVQRITGPETWASIARRRREDLLLHKVEHGLRLRLALQGRVLGLFLRRCRC